MNFRKVGKFFSALCGYNNRTVLTAVSASGVISTVALAIRATKRLIDKKDEIAAAETTGEKAKIIAKEVALPLASCAITELVIFKNHKAASDTIAALSQTLTLTTGAYNAYQQIVTDNVDEDQLDKIQKLFAEKTHNETVKNVQENTKEDIKENPKVLTKMIVDTGTGTSLFELDGILFRANKGFVDGVFNDADFDLGSEGYISVDELHDKLGIKTKMNTDPIDKELQWDRMNRGDRIKAVYKPVVDETLNDTVNVITYAFQPRPKYRRC